MASTKSRANKPRSGGRNFAPLPQRENGRQRVEAILIAGAALIAERGFDATTMAEIALRAGAHTGSLYRFFPTKEHLANALIARYHQRLDADFLRLKERLPRCSIGELSDALLDLMIDIRQDAGPTIRRLLDVHAGVAIKRGAFRKEFQRHITDTLILFRPQLDPALARVIAVVLLGNMKGMAVLREERTRDSGRDPIAELRIMTRLYLEDRLG